MRELREKTLEAAKTLSGEDRVIIYGCQHGGDFNVLEGPGVAVLSLPCIAMLPPSFVDFVVTRHHVDGVLLTGCRDGDCHFRLGIQWTQARIAGQRDPYLRKRVPRERIEQFWGGPTQLRQLSQSLEAFRTRLKELGSLGRSTRSNDVQSAAQKLKDHG